MTDQEASVVPASSSDTRNGEVSLYCVIGPTATQNYGRTWKKLQADAEAHARKLIRNSTVDGKAKLQRLFVVQVVSVVEVPQPTLTVRSTTAEDYEDLTSGGDYSVLVSPTRRVTFPRFEPSDRSRCSGKFRVGSWDGE